MVESQHQHRAHPLLHTLLFDADDTLWQNNVYFERAIASFMSLVDHAGHTPDEVRRRLDAVERQTIQERGYGTGSFRLSLLRCLEELSRRPVSDVEHAQITRFVDAIVDAEIELLPGVQASLDDLHQHHRLILVTKGNDLEQRVKLRRSGLEAAFDAVEVLAEKTAAAYLELAARHACDPSRTWMIGNSPRSDINPALQAGLNAVFIPHADTWVLEHETLAAVPAGQRLLVLQGLNELAAQLPA